jgi:hypothetical protein
LLERLYSPLKANRLKKGKLENWNAQITMNMKWMPNRQQKMSYSLKIDFIQAQYFWTWKCLFYFAYITIIMETVWHYLSLIFSWGTHNLNQTSPTQGICQILINTKKAKHSQHGSFQPKIQLFMTNTFYLKNVTCTRWVYYAK